VGAVSTEATVAVEEATDESVVLAVSGEVDLSNAAEVEGEILDRTSNTLTDVTLDLSAVTYLDSAGLRVLFTLATRLLISQISLVLVVPLDSPVRRALELGGMDTVAEVRPTRS
jgi:anti-anti-sigma factor